MPRPDPARGAAARARSWSCTTRRRTPPSRTRRRSPRHDPRVRTVLNTYGRGPANAIRFGIDAARGAGRGRDDGRRLRRPAPDRRPGPAGRPGRGGRRRVPLHARRPAGRRAAVQADAVALGRAQRCTASPGSAPATRPTASRRTDTDFVREVGIESRTGFEIGLELTAKATRLRLPGRRDPDDLARPAARRVAASTLGRFLPSYLRWYRFAFGRRLTARAARARGGPRASRRDAGRRDKEGTSRGEGPGHRFGRVHRRVRRRGAARAAATRWSGVDNYSKYGPVAHSYDDHPRYRFVEGDARDVELLTELLADCDHFIAGAAMIGGISYFHAYAYDLLATNERIMAASCDAAIAAHRDGRLQKVTYMSSSMVFESTDHWPSQGGRRAARSRRRCRRTGSRSSPWSTTRGPRGTSTSCRTRSCGRSTASASARAGRSARPRCCPAT